MDTLTELQNLDGKRLVKRIVRNAVTGEPVTFPFERGAKFFRAVSHPVGSIRDIATALDHIALSPTSCVIRGEPARPGQGRVQRRCKTGDEFFEKPRRWVLYDIDGVEMPPGMDWRVEPEAAVRYAVGLMPKAFHGVTCWWAFSAGQGFKPNLHLRLAFWLDVAVSGADLTVWLAEKIPDAGPRKSWRRVSPGDPAVYRTVQPIYVGRPVFEDGIVDPVPRRSGLLHGRRDVVSVPLPIVPRLSGAVERSARTKGVVAGTPLREPVTDPYEAEGSGFAFHVAGIGDGPGGDGFHGPMTAAVAAWIGQHGPEVDAAPMIAAVASAARAAQRDPARHSSGYVEAQISGLPAFVEWVRGEERKKADLLPAFGPVCDAGRAPPTMSVDEASSVLTAAVDGAFAAMLAVIADQRARAASMTTDDQRDARDAQRFFDGPALPRIAIGAGIGLGKTEAAVRAIVRAVDADRTLVVAYAAPNHTTAGDIATRVNRLAGRPMAAVWRGTGQPDPARPQRQVCPMHNLVAEVCKTGGKVRDVCGGPVSGWCDHNPGRPDQTPGNACAYRQQFDPAVQVWIVAHAMLTSAAPTPFLTGARARLGGPFDMLVLDEAPWLSFIGGCGPRPVQVLVEDLIRLASWPAGGDWRAEYLAIGRRLADALDGQDGYLKRDRLIEAGLSATMADQAAGLSWRLVRKLPIRRDLPPEAASFALHEHGGSNGAAALVRRFWTILAAFLRSGAPVAPQTLQVGRDADGRLIVRLRWKEEMHRDWTRGPILYLDATLVPEVAACWLSGLRVEAVVQAAETDVYRVALLDRQNGKTSLVAAKTEAEEKRQARTVAKIVYLIEKLAFRYRGQGRATADGRPGPDVAVVGYDAFERRVRPLLPANVAVGHFNNLRGFDGWRGVRAIVVVGRPEPSPRDVEQYASIASGELVAPCPGKWYPAVAASHLMRDGTGRSIRGSAHPHPLVEAFRRQVQTELPQVEGRARPVRRGPRDPLASYVLTSTPTDLPLDEVTTEGDLLGSTGMLALLAARGIVPDTAADAARVLSDLFDGSAGASDAFRQRLLREGRTDGLAALFDTGEDACRGAGGEVVTFPYQSLLGICHNFAAMPRSRYRHDALPDAILGFRCFRYRPHDRRTGGSVLLDTGLHSDPEAALQAVVGPLASFVPAPAPSWLAAIQAPYVRAGRTPIPAAADVAISLPRAPSPFRILLATRSHAANSMLPLAGEIYTVGAKRLSVHIYPQADGSDLKLYRRLGAVWPPVRAEAKRIVVDRRDRPAAAEPTVTAIEIAAALGLRHRALVVGPSFARLERQFGREKALVYRMVEKVGAEAVQAASAKCLALAEDR